MSNWRNQLWKSVLENSFKTHLAWKPCHIIFYSQSNHEWWSKSGTWWNYLVIWNSETFANRLRRSSFKNIFFPITVMDFDFLEISATFFVTLDSFLPIPTLKDDLGEKTAWKNDNCWVMKVFAHAHSGCQSEQSPSIKLIMETGRSYAFQAKLSFTATTVPPSKCPPDHPTPKFNAPTYSIRHNAPYLMIESACLLLPSFQFSCLKSSSIGVNAFK